MLIRPQVFCLNCNTKVDYSINPRQVTLDHKGITFTYQETQAHCVNCHNLVYVPALADRNCRERLKAYYINKEKNQNGST